MVTLLIVAAALTVQQATLQPPEHAPISVAPEIAGRYPSGTEIFKVSVSPEGVVSTCVVSITGRGPITDIANCKKLKRLKAKPAVDQNGRKIYGFASFIVSWNVLRAGHIPSAPSAMPQIEPDLYLPLNRLPNGIRSDATSVLLLVAGADGKMETCEVQQTSGLAALDEAACRAVAVAGVTPATDADGATVRAVHSVRVGFAVRP